MKNYAFSYIVFNIYYNRTLWKLLVLKEYLPNDILVVL